MNIKLHRSVEQWLACGPVLNIIEDVRADNGCEPDIDIDIHTDSVERLQERVYASLEDAGYAVAWVSTQRIGYGAVVQNWEGRPNRTDPVADAAFDSALDANEEWFAEQIALDCVSEAESRPVE